MGDESLPDPDPSRIKSLKEAVMAAVIKTFDSESQEELRSALDDLFKEWGSKSGNQAALKAGFEDLVYLSSLEFPQSLWEELVSGCNSTRELFDFLIKCRGEDRRALLLRFLRDKSWQVRIKAVREIQQPFDPEFSALLDRMVDGDDDYDVRAEALLSLMAEAPPEHRKSLIFRGLDNLFPEVQARAVRELRDRPEPDLAARLEHMAEDDTVLPTVKVEIAKKMLLFGLGNPRLHILQMLESHDWMVRKEGVEAIGDDDDPYWIDVLLDFARDSDNDVREASLRRLVLFDDPRTFAELVAALDDEDGEVIDAARELLFEDPPTSPTLRRMAAEEPLEPLVEGLRQSIQETRNWGEQVAFRELGRPVKVVRLAQGLGRTGMSRKERGKVILEVSDLPVTSRHPDGVTIMKGLILHELGHHLYDRIDNRGHLSVAGQVRQERLDDIFPLLKDERLERRLRGRWPEAATYFDRLARHAFMEKSVKIERSVYARIMGLSPAALDRELSAKRCPGTLSDQRSHAGERLVIIPFAELMPIPDVVTPRDAFMFCLRAGFNPELYYDSRLTDVMAEVPGNLKDLDHPGMLCVARRIKGKLDAMQGDARKARDRSEEKKRRFPLEMLQALRKILEKQLEELNELQMNPDEDFAPGPLPESPDASGRSGASRSSQAPRTASPGAFNSWQGLSGGEDFSPLGIEPAHDWNPYHHAQLVAPLRPQIRALRVHFEKLGQAVIEEEGRRQGRRLDQGRAARFPALGDPSIWVQRRDAEAANAYLGVVIDKSGSMSSPNASGDDKMHVAKSFGALVAESARGIRGLSGDIGAFDDQNYYHLGDLRRCAISALEAGGGNNDAGGLSRAAELALASGKRHRLLIMISDGEPTECTVEALQGLAERLERSMGIALIQVAVDKIDHKAFADFLDLSACSFQEAVSLFAKAVHQRTAHWK